MIEVSKQLPHSLEAERAILGAILLDNLAYLQADILSTEDFYLNAHRYIYGGMCSLASDNRPIDYVTLTEKLGQRTMVDCGGVAYVTSLTDGLPRVKNIEQYVKIVLGYSRRRKFVQLMAVALEDGYTDGVEIEQLIKITESQLLEIETVKSKQGLRHVREVIVEADAQIEEESKITIDRVAIGLSSGLKSYDEFTTGFRKRELTIIGGWTSDGKSAFMRQAVIKNILQGIRVAVFTHEVSAARLTLDIKAFISEVSPKHIRDPRLMEMFERTRFKDVNKILQSCGLWLCDNARIHIDDLEHMAIKSIRQDAVDLICVDFIGLVNGNGHNKTEKTDDVVDGLWHLADSEKVPVIGLCQMSRDQKKIKRRPSLQDLKQTSDLEQRAHNVAFVYQPETDEGVRIYDKAEIIVAKQRHGSTGILRARFNKENLTFEERY